MPERVYAVLLHVPESHLTTVLDVVRVPTVLVSVTPTEETRSSNGSSRARPRYANGKRLKGITGMELAERFAKEINRVFNGTELKHAFLNNGFAENSYSPSLNRLVKLGKVRNLGDGKYVAAGVTLRIGG